MYIVFVTLFVCSSFWSSNFSSKSCVNLASPFEVSATYMLLLQFQFGVCACVRSDVSGPKLVHLCMDFKIIGHSCCPRGAEVPFETFDQVG